MKPIFESKFQDVYLLDAGMQFESMFVGGFNLYMDFIPLMNKMQKIDERLSLSEMYAKLDITPYSPISKRALYSGYEKGIVVGAGSGEDCKDLIRLDEWSLFDLTDSRMINKAVSHSNYQTQFKKLGDKEADTLSYAKEDRIQEYFDIECISIDSLDLDPQIISIDAEGSGIDVLAGAVKTIERCGPDILIGIYHNWIEYLFSVPMLYDMGYDISAVLTTNFVPTQPHLELSLYAKRNYD